MMDFAQTEERSFAPREKRPKHPLVEPGEARGASDIDERRYLASAITSGGATLDGFPLDLDAAIGSDPIRAVLRAIEALRREGKPTSQEHIERWVRDHVEDPTRLAALTVLSSEQIFADDLDPVALTLRQRGQMRRMKREALALLDACASSRFAPALAACEKLRDLTSETQTEDVAVLLSEAMRQALPPKPQPGEPVRQLSPIINIDPLLTDKVRLRRGEVLVLGLATNVGKSTIMERWAREAKRQGSSALLISIEDNVDLFGNKALAAEAEVNRDDLADNVLEPEDRARAEHAIAAEAAAERNGPFVRIVRVRSRKLDEVCRWIRRGGALGCAVVFVDFLQAIKTERTFRQRKDQVDHVLNEILAAAASANVALVVSSQFARREKTAADMKRPPVLADLKESGDIENSATYVVMGWRTKNDAHAVIFAKVEKNKSKGFLGNVGGWQRDRLGILRTWERQNSARDEYDDNDDGGGF